MKIIYPIDIHLDRREPCPILDAVQGETGRAVAVSLYEKGQPWSVPAGAHVVVRYARPDACGGIYDTLPGGGPACSIQDNTVTAQLTPQALAVAGMVSVQLAIVSGNALLATFIFWVRVESDPSAGTAAAEDYVNLLPQLIQDAKTCTGAADRAELSAKQAAASLDANLELMGQVQAQSYFAQQHAMQAAQSATTAEDAAKRAEDAAASMGDTGTPGADGEDGGYYQPYVETLEDGNLRLSFIGSKQDMPQVPIFSITLPAGKDGAVGPQGPQGEKGDKGDKGDPGESAIVDDTLSQAGQAADAKAVGDLFEQATEEINGAMQTLAGTIPTDDHINALIDAKLGVIENGTY